MIELWYNSPFGKSDIQRKAIHKFTRVYAAKALSSTGGCEVHIPIADRDLVNPGGVLEVWQYSGYSSKLFNAYIIEKMVFSDQDQNLVLVGVDGNDLPSRRIVNYVSGSPQATASNEYAETLMKRVVRENLGDLAPSNRSLSQVGLVVDPYMNFGPQVSMAFAWKPVLEVLEKIRSVALNLGTPLFWNFSPYLSQYGISWRFQVFINQPGRNLSSQIVFSTNYGNLAEAKYTVDYTNSKSVAIVGGRGTEADRDVVTVSSPDVETYSPLAKREIFVNAGGQTSTSLTSEGISALIEHKPQRILSGILLDSSRTRYGLDWDWGDLVAVSVAGITAKALVSQVEISVENSVESIQAKFEVMI